ncbi:MAG: hypothetical protein JWM28_2165 [Chitinophagaceae bacterium]|nr:hypothetical protein [Chitinophagaceae bacterium]
MKQFTPGLIVITAFFLISLTGYTSPVIYINQVAYDLQGPKMAVIRTDEEMKGTIKFTLINLATSKEEFTGQSGTTMTIEEWAPGSFFLPRRFHLVPESR